MRLLLAIGVALSVMAYPAARFQQTSPTIQTDPFSAADVYAEDDPALKPPRLVNGAKPNYTSAAMRSRIEGVVKMAAIVERDGSIGTVRVTQSLDPDGLDVSAVETVKKWRFLPATKDGVPVRARITVEMSFSLGRNEITGRSLAWPASFFVSVSPFEYSVDSWAQSEIAAGSLRISVRYPKAWKTSPAAASRMFTATSDDHRYPRTFVLSRPLPTQLDLTANLTDEAMNKMADAVKKTVASARDDKLLAFGQIRAPLRLWFWAELTRRPPRSPAGQDIVHLWLFTTTEQRQEVTVFCSVVEPSDSDALEMRDQLNRAGADFAAMISRIEISPR